MFNRVSQPLMNPGLTQIQHAARDLFIFNPLNPPCQGDFGNSGGLMNQLRKSYRHSE